MYIIHVYKVYKLNEVVHIKKKFTADTFIWFLIFIWFLMPVVFSTKISTRSESAIFFSWNMYKVNILFFEYKRFISF